MKAPVAALKTALDRDDFSATLTTLYGEAEVEAQKHRYFELLEAMEERFGNDEALLVRAPGRTELSGNHTDHQQGLVLAAAVDLDCAAVAAPSGEAVVTIVSMGYPLEISLDITSLEPRVPEQGTPQALVRGVAAGFVDQGYAVGGFHACLHATCLPGIGLSSSAAFAVLIGMLFDTLYNSGRATVIELAQIARYAENRFFGKPCGLMDQLASAAGGVLLLDFKEPDRPVITPVRSRVCTGPYQLVLVDTGGSHIELTPEYAAIPAEVGRAAAVLGQEVARDLSLGEVVPHLAAIRRQAGDRALLRLLHCIEENERVRAQAAALDENRTRDYLALVRASGDSSWRLLQNCMTQTSSTEQGIALALKLSELFLDDGAWRVHGGGFAGAIQVYVPADALPDYTRNMEQVFGAGCVLPLRIGAPGVCLLDPRGLVSPEQGRQ